MHDKYHFNDTMKWLNTSTESTHISLGYEEKLRLTDKLTTVLAFTHIYFYSINSKSKYTKLLFDSHYFFCSVLFYLYFCKKNIFWIQLSLLNNYTEKVQSVFCQFLLVNKYKTTTITK